MLKPNQSFFVYQIQNKENSLQKKSFLRKRESVGLNIKQKEDFLTALAMVMKKEPIRESMLIN